MLPQRLAQKTRIISDVGKDFVKSLMKTKITMWSSITAITQENIDALHIVSVI